ncbi:hypothetical protein [Virgibacillus ndiopensis]|uniref:hypothetical protein n=1 Tax=Virgibacillus ndiopensis TaxID=2004408 RepID=UPI000C07CB6C|nr:hypothetical protein [Virgibacillus ndiopensis]
MDSIRIALEAYRIEALKIDRITDKLYAVYDGKQVFALKRSKMTTEQIKNWEAVYHRAYSQNLTGILSVYLTADGKLFKEVDGEFYYITPWLLQKKENQKQEFEVLYKTIGAIHENTKQPVSNNIEKVRDQFKQYQAYCTNIKSRLLSYVETFEKNRYMSPFELLVCSQFRDLDLFLNELNRRIDYFMDELNEQSDWNISLCHKQLNTSHVLQSDTIYITNWEGAQFDNAVVDLSIYLKNQVKYYDQPAEQIIDSFPVYLEKNKLTNSELYLLCIYLFDPSTYIRIIKRYTGKISTYSMLQQIRELQHAYRQLIFAMKWSEHVDEFTVSSIDNLES